MKQCNTTQILKYSILALSTFGISSALIAKPASEMTIQKNNAVYAQLPFEDQQDFADAQRGGNHSSSI